MKVLVCEDESEVASFLQDALSDAGYAVERAADGKQAMELVSSKSYDAIILDLMLPEIDGLTVLRTAREMGIKTPILILTAKFKVEDRVEGLDSGANDYLVKPFALKELLARVRVLLRHPGESSLTLTSCDVELDPASRRVTHEGKVIFLSSTEFSLLHFLMSNEGRVLSRSEILSTVWDDQGFRGSNVVDVYINYLRSKIHPNLIQTIRGSGYVFGKSHEN